MFIDTHAHLNFKAFKNDFDEVFKASLDANVGKIINIGSNYETSLTAVRKIHEGDLYPAVGLHPIHLSEDVTETELINNQQYSFTTKKEEFQYVKFRELAKNEKVVAIGETGLDYFHLNSQNLNFGNAINMQKDVFKQHIKLAKELRLPLILHCRGAKKKHYDAYNELINILKDEEYFDGVVHCFTGNLKQAKDFINLGFFIGVNGIVTFANSTELHEIIREIPLESIVLETDCPYLAPDPYRGRRNEPKYIPIIAQKIAELKNIPLSEVEEQTTKNAEKLFGL